jgi:hypothetical protein
MVAAMRSYRYLVLIRSAALRKMAARSANGSDSQSALASRAESMAARTCCGDASEYVATVLWWSAGLACLPVE